jgi:hypothetical protein
MQNEINTQTASITTNNSALKDAQEMVNAFNNNFLTAAKNR